MTSAIPVLNPYHTNISTSIAPTQNTINFVPIAPNIKTQKTITLMCGNKTFTLTGGTFQPGTQYVLTKLKGKPTALMLTDQKKIIAMNEPDKIKIEPTASSMNQLTVPSTSQQPITTNKQSLGTKSTSKKVRKDCVNFNLFFNLKYNKIIINVFIYSRLVFWENNLP